MPKLKLKKSNPLPEEPPVNLTPLIDVVFVILIGFILMAPLLEADSVELAEGSNAPSTPSVSLQEKSPITLYVKRDNSVWLGSQKVSIEGLPELLKAAKSAYPTAVPQLFHDKKAYFGNYQSVKNALEEAGFERVDVVLNPP